MSTNHIRVLSRIVADQIAAGEVVERPASVVKELVENSLDAGATRVQVEIDAGGIARIRVRDNGTGMSAEDAELAFGRHATSKLEEIEDLDGVSTFGFRGEALPSIASVSKVSLETRTREDVAGFRLELVGGEVAALKVTGCPVGADIEVAELFFNTPARLKFLKRDSTEAGHCAESLVRLALVRPDVAFTLVSSGRKIRELKRAERPEERVAELFPDELLAVGRGSEGGVEVLAVLGPPHKARAGAGSLYTYVNGRFVRDRSMLKAVAQGFAGTLQPGCYPAGLVAITLPPGGVDVNVHPQKIEVRFADGAAVYRAVSRVVGEMAARAVWSRGTYPVPVPSALPERTGETPSPYGTEGSGRLVPPPLVSSRSPSVPIEPKRGEGRTQLPGGPALFRAESQPLVESRDPSGGSSFSSMRYVGQARGVFLILEDERDLVLIDQHAAHERVTYERLLAELEKGELSSQRLIAPHHVDLGPAEVERIVVLAPQLARLGLDISRSGADRVAVHSVPAAVGHVAPDRLLAELVIALESGRSGSHGSTDDTALATLACHGSIRGGRPVTEGEVRTLLSQMDRIDFAGHCPHGRPVVARIPWSEISKRVGRE